MSEVLEAIRPLFSETVQTSKWCDTPSELVKQMGDVAESCGWKMQLLKNDVKSRLWTSHVLQVRMLYFRQ